MFLAQRASILRWLGNASLFAAVLLSIVFTLPFSLRFPSAGLDPSWLYALNEAVARHLVFGRDIIFTCGPLASVYSAMYHPATDWILIAGSLLFGAGLCLGLALLAYPKRLWLVFCLPLLIATVVSRNAATLDAGCIVLPFLLVALLARVCESANHEWRLPVTGSRVLGIAVVTCAVAILPLIKGSFGMVAFCSIAISFYVLFRRKRLVAICFAGLVFATILTTWLSVGQPIGALPQYFLSQSVIISSYSEAMSVDGPVQELLIYLGLSFALLIVLYQQLAEQFRDSGIVLSLMLAITLFVGFKAGFVRHDAHSLIAAGILVLTGYTLSLLVKPVASWMVLALSVVGWVYIEHSETGFGIRTAIQRIEQTVVNSYEGINTRLRAPGELNAQFERANAAIRGQEPIATVDGTVDVYPFDLAAVFAYKLDWDPRPIFQSYSCYNSTLDTKNRMHLEGDEAPRTIFFGVWPIDNRLPALEDSGSWPLLLTRYKIADREKTGLRLTLQANSYEQIFGSEMTPIAGRAHKPITLPNVPGPLWGEIDLSPTILGRVMDVILKNPPVQITLTLEDGRVVRRRYIPVMGRSGFLISPYVETTEDFARLAAGDYERNRVRSIQIDPQSTRFWSRDFMMRFRNLNIKRQVAARIAGQNFEVFSNE